MYALGQADSRPPVALTQLLVAEPPRGPRSVSSRARGITPQAKTGQLRLWGPSPSGPSGRFELGVGGPVEVRLLGAPGLVVAAGLPVAGRGQLLARDAAIEDEVPADLAGDGGLAVHERVDVAGGEVQVADRARQRIAGAVAVQPREVQVAGRLERDLVLRSRDLDDHVHGRAGGDAQQRRRDGRDGGEIADHEVPGGVGLGRVAAAGAHELQDVAGLRAGRPGARDALVAVHDEVDREAPLLGVPVADGVGAHARPLLARVALLHLLGVERRVVLGAGRRDVQLDVVVGELADAEAVQVFAADDHADEVRAQVLRLEHGGDLRAAPGPGWASRSCVAQPTMEPLGRMEGLAARPVADLLAAGGAGRDDVALGGADRREEDALAHAHGDVVVLALVAEQAGHAAAAAVERLHGRPRRELERADRRRRADERLLVAVRVQDHRAAGRQLRRVELEQRLLEQARRGGDALDARVTGQQPRVVVADGEDAARLQPGQRDAPLRERVEQLQVAGGVAAGVVDEALAEHRAPAADDLGEQHAGARGREHADGCLADVGALVVRPRVVEERDLRAVPWGSAPKRCANVLSRHPRQPRGAGRCRRTSRPRGGRAGSRRRR